MKYLAATIVGLCIVATALAQSPLIYPSAEPPAGMFWKFNGSEWKPARAPSAPPFPHASDIGGDGIFLPGPPSHKSDPNFFGSFQPQPSNDWTLTITIQFHRN